MGMWQKRDKDFGNDPIWSSKLWWSCVLCVRDTYDLFQVDLETYLPFLRVVATTSSTTIHDYVMTKNGTGLLGYITAQHKALPSTSMVSWRKTTYDPYQCKNDSKVVNIKQCVTTTLLVDKISPIFIFIMYILINLYAKFSSKTMSVVRFVHSCSSFYTIKYFLFVWSS